VGNKNLQLEYLREKLIHRQENIIKEKNNRLEKAAEKTDLLSPLKTLSRGYSITFSQEGRLIKDSENVEEKENINVKLFKGNLICNVIEVKKMSKKVSFEDSMEKLEKIISLLEQGDVELEKSLEYFTEGIEMIKSCKTELVKAEEKVKILIEDELQEFTQLKGE
jgi:exodeoxyribonuclease VII small subunit